MKIAYIVPYLTNTGPLIVVHSLVKYLIDKVEKIDVYYFDSKTDLIFDCPTHRISKNTPIDFDSYDIVHAHCLRSDLYVWKWRKVIRKALIVTTLHQDTYKSFTYEYNKITSFFLTLFWLHIQREFNGITTISNQLKNIYNQRLSSKVESIYNGCYINIDLAKVDHNMSNLMLRLKDEKYKIIGSYAYITKRKGLRQIILILPKLIDYVFVIIGEGPEVENLKLLSRKLEVNDRVFFFPYMKEPYNFLPFFDIYAMPSYSEGFGLSMVEAALASKSIICSNIDSFHEIFDSTEATFFDIDDERSVIESLNEAYENKTSKGENAFKKASKKFSAQRMAENYLSYYNNLLVQKQLNNNEVDI